MPHCGRAVQVDSEPHCEPTCECGHQFCFACCQAPHTPCSCEMCAPPCHQTLTASGCSVELWFETCRYVMLFNFPYSGLMGDCSRQPSKHDAWLQMAAVAGEDVGREREQDVDDGQHEALPQVPVARGKELRLQPRDLPLRPGEKTSRCTAGGHLIYSLRQAVVTACMMLRQMVMVGCAIKKASVTCCGHDGTQSARAHRECCSCSNAGAALLLAVRRRDGAVAHVDIHHSAHLRPLQRGGGPAHRRRGQVQHCLHTTSLLQTSRQQAFRCLSSVNLCRACRACTWQLLDDHPQGPEAVPPLPGAVGGACGQPEAGGGADQGHPGSCALYQLFFGYFATCTRAALCRHSSAERRCVHAFNCDANLHTCPRPRLMLFVSQGVTGEDCSASGPWSHSDAKFHCMSSTPSGPGLMLSMAPGVTGEDCSPGGPGARRRGWRPSAQGLHLAHTGACCVSQQNHM